MRGFRQFRTLSTVVIVASIALISIAVSDSNSAPPNSWSHALIRPGNNRLVSTIALKPSVALGTVVDITLEQFVSYAGVPVTLTRLSPHEAPKGVQMVSAFLANLCGPHPDPLGDLVVIEKPRLGIRTYYPNSQPTHALKVLTIAEINRIYPKRRLSGDKCRLLPRVMWVIRVTSRTPGEYKWHGLDAYYRIGSRQYKEFLPQLAFDFTWKSS